MTAPRTPRDPGRGWELQGLYAAREALPSTGEQNVAEIFLLLRAFLLKARQRSLFRAIEGGVEVAGSIGQNGVLVRAQDAFAILLRWP